MLTTLLHADQMNQVTVTKKLVKNVLVEIYESHGKHFRRQHWIR